LDFGKVGLVGGMVGSVVGCLV